MTLQEFLGNESLVADYQKAVQSDAVQIGIGVLRELYCRPAVPDADKLNKSTSEFCLGQNFGSWLLLDALQALGRLDPSAMEELRETYGAKPEAPNKKNAEDK
jgi:hypothetical protein